MLISKLFEWPYTVEFRRLGQCFLDWATAVVGEADRELAAVVAQSMKLDLGRERCLKILIFQSCTSLHHVIEKRNIRCFTWWRALKYEETEKSSQQLVEAGR